MKTNRIIKSLFVQLIIFFSLILISCERIEYCAACYVDGDYSETLCDDNLRRLERQIKRKESTFCFFPGMCEVVECEEPHEKW